MYHTSASKEETIDHNKIQNEMNKMMIFKKNVMQYAQKKLKNMTKAAAKVNMKRKDGELVHFFWILVTYGKTRMKKNLTNIPRNIYYVSYRRFNENLDWSTKLEKQYMIFNDVKYKNDDEESNNDNRNAGIEKKKTIKYNRYVHQNSSTLSY